MNCCVAPEMRETDAGVTAIALRVGPAAAVTVRLAVAVTPLSFAVMVVDPAEIPVARPAVLMEATAVEELVQLTAEVRFWVEPSL